MSRDKFTVRALRRSDSVEALTRLLNRAYAELGAMGLNYTAVDQTPDVTEQRISGAQCFVAERQGVLIGTVLVKPTDPGSACSYFAKPGVSTLGQFGVDPAYRRMGVGLKLLRTCEEWARTNGFKELALDTAKPATHLVALYGRLGYVPVGEVRWPGKVYESVVMSKALGGVEQAG